MKHSLNSIFFYVTAVLTFLGFLIFASMYSMWSGIIAMTGSWVPYLLFLVLCILSFLFLWLWLKKKHSLIITIPGFILTAAFLSMECYMISQTKDSWAYFLHTGRQLLIFAAGIALLAMLTIIASKYNFHKKPYAVFLVILGFFILSMLVYFKPFGNAITGTPVIYAVSSNYQIVFTTKQKGTGFVIIDGKTYADTVSGIRVCDTTVHKVTVPMEALEEAKSYTVGTKRMYLCGPYCSMAGSVITKDFSFRGADFTDGLQYYVLSDTHTDTDACIKAASYFGSQLDFLVLAGDHLNWASDSYSMKYLLTIAQKVTKGEVPVIFARGNHEARGKDISELPRYTGCEDDRFYYTFRIKNLWGIVLDLGQDNPDDYTEFSGLSEFDTYRKEETLFLENVLLNKEKEYDADGVTYRIAICHIPLTLISENDFLKSYKTEWVNYLNQMNINILFQGHLHKLFYVEGNQLPRQPLTYSSDFGAKDSEPDWYTTNANFPAVFVSRKGTSQLLSVPADTTWTHFTGLSVTADNTSTCLSYTDENKHIINPVISAFENGVSYGPVITVPNKN